jgi:hypothetical protein
MGEMRHSVHHFIKSVGKKSLTVRKDGARLRMMLTGALNKEFEGQTEFIWLRKGSSSGV